MPPAAIKNDISLALKVKIQMKNNAKTFPPKLAYSEVPAGQIEKLVKHLLVLIWRFYIICKGLQTIN